MTAIGRPLESVSINGREFQCVGDAAGTRNLGGFTGEWQPNGNPKTGRKIMTPIGWSVGGQALVCDDAQKDHEFLSAISKSATESDFVFNYGQGILYQGTGHIVDNVEYDAMAATASVSFAGAGDLVQL